MTDNKKELNEQDLNLPIHRLLCEWGLCISGAQARRTMYLGGVKVNGEKVNNMNLTFNGLALKDENTLTVGKQQAITFSVKKEEKDEI